MWAVCQCKNVFDNEHSGGSIWASPEHRKIISIFVNRLKQKSYPTHPTLTLAYEETDAPPLPLCEMLSSEHFITQIIFWLIQFLPRLLKYTSTIIHWIKTDHNWVIM